MREDLYIRFAALAGPVHAFDTVGYAPPEDARIGFSVSSTLTLEPTAQQLGTSMVAAVEPERIETG